MVTYLIRNAKRDCNLKTLGPNPASRTIYKHLKNHLLKNQKQPEVPDIEKLNEYFATIGCLVNKIPLHHEAIKVPNNFKTMVLSCTDEIEVSKTIQTLKNKKVMIMMILATKC